MLETMGKVSCMATDHSQRRLSSKTTTREVSNSEQGSRSRIGSSTPGHYSMLRLRWPNKLSSPPRCKVMPLSIDQPFYVAHMIQSILSNSTCRFVSLSWISKNPTKAPSVFVHVVFKVPHASLAKLQLTKTIQDKHTQDARQAVFV